MPIQAKAKRPRRIIGAGALAEAICNALLDKGAISKRTFNAGELWGEIVARLAEADAAGLSAEHVLDWLAGPLSGYMLPSAGLPGPHKDRWQQTVRDLMGERA